MVVCRATTTPQRSQSARLVLLAVLRRGLDDLDHGSSHDELRRKSFAAAEGAEAEALVVSDPSVFDVSVVLRKHCFVLWQQG